MKSHFVYWAQMGMLRPKEAYLPTWVSKYVFTSNEEARNGFVHET